jgi:hypothetical protein
MSARSSASIGTVIVVATTEMTRISEKSSEGSEAYAPEPVPWMKAYQKDVRNMKPRSEEARRRKRAERERRGS